MTARGWWRGLRGERRRGTGRARGRVRGWATLAAAVALVLCGPAQSGVAAQDADRDLPDMALVVAGDSGRTVALRSGQRDFARLWQLLGPTRTGTEQVPEAWAEGHYPKVQATVIWGLTGIGGWPFTKRAPGGDVAIERQDQIFLAEDGTAWVRTDPAPDVADDDIRWHRAQRAVYDEVVRSGLFEPAEPAKASADEGAAAAARWAIPGLGAGLALGAGGSFLMRRAAARREPGPPREPRQELIDL